MNAYITNEWITIHRLIHNILYRNSMHQILCIEYDAYVTMDKIYCI
jgi:hypothetical protein